MGGGGWGVCWPYWAGYPSLSVIIWAGHSVSSYGQVSVLSFVSASLLPGYLSKRAHVLRFLFRGLAKVIDAFL